MYIENSPSPPHIPVTNLLKLVDSFMCIAWIPQSIPINANKNNAFGNERKRLNNASKIAVV